MGERERIQEGDRKPPGQDQPQQRDQLEGKDQPPIGLEELARYWDAVKLRQSVEKTVQHLPVIDLRGVVKKDDRVESVYYPDGKGRSFEYDDHGALSKVTQPDGSVWTRAAGSDSWSTTTGKKFSGTIEVDGTGVYSYVDRSGVRNVFKLDGTKEMEKEIIGAQNLKPLFESNLKAIDSNGDGMVSKDELKGALKKGVLQDEGHAMAVALRENFDAIKKLSNDQTFFETKISRADIQKFDEQRKAATESELLGRTIDSFGGSKFYRLDSNENKFISRDELNSALAGEAFSAEEKVTIQKMVDHYDELRKSSNDETFRETTGITSKDLDEFRANRRGTAEYQRVMDVDWSMKVSDPFFRAHSGLEGKVPPIPMYRSLRSVTSSPFFSMRQIMSADDAYSVAGDRMLMMKIMGGVAGAGFWGMSVVQSTSATLRTNLLTAAAVTAAGYGLMYMAQKETEESVRKLREPAVQSFENSIFRTRDNRTWSVERK